jgi:hypothetical protein
MFGAYFMLVPVHTGKCRAKYLHTIHTNVSGIGDGVFCVNNGKRNKGSSILWPAGNNREFGNIRCGHDHFLTSTSPFFTFGIQDANSLNLGSNFNLSIMLSFGEAINLKSPSISCAISSS